MAGTLKQRLHDGDNLNIIRIPMDSTSEFVESTIVEGKPDMLYIDCQHGPYTEWDIVRICKAAVKHGVGVQLRIKHKLEAYKCGNMCDLGLFCIKVPEVRKLEEIEMAVQSFYFPPFGIRSWGGNVGFNPDKIGLEDGKDIDMLAYAKWWNENGVLGFKIENVEAVLNIRSLVIPGIDYVDFGPSDLTFDLAIVNHPYLKTVEDCKDFVRKELKDVDVCLML